MRLFPSLKVKIESWVTWINDPEFSHCWEQNLKGREKFVIFQSLCAVWAIHRIIRVHFENMSAESERQPVALLDSPSDTLKMLVNALIRLVFAAFWKKRKRQKVVHGPSEHSCLQTYNCYLFLHWTFSVSPLNWISSKLWLHSYLLKS